MTHSYARQDFIMNTTVEQMVSGDDSERICAQVVSLLQDLEAMMSFFLDDSDVSTLNRYAGRPVSLHLETLSVLRCAKTFAQASGSAFDITVAGVVDLWRSYAKRREIPPPGEIEARLEFVGDDHLVVNDQTACLTTPGCSVDLGGIAKGFAAEQCIEFYRQQGIESAFINLGGNVRTLGVKADGKDWRIGLQHPDKARGTLFGAVVAPDRAIVTSGGYERGVTVEDRFYHHIIDPRTGWPSISDLKSVTVICEDSMAADALATAAFVLGLDAGLALIRAHHGQAVFVTADDKVYLTSGLRHSFQLDGTCGFSCYLAGT